MKKIFTLIAAIALTTTAANAQRIYDITFEGVTPLSKCGYKNPTGTPPTGALLEVVFPENTDLSNIKATPVPSDTLTTIVTKPLPTDFTKSVSLDIRKDDDKAVPAVHTTLSYNVVFRTIKAASLPLNIDFSTTNMPVWNSSTVGWAATCVNEAKSSMYFDNSNRGFILAFKDVPATLSYKISSTSTWNSGGIFDVEESNNGVAWTSVFQYTADIGSTALPKSHNLKSTTRFVRFNYTLRNGANVLVNNFAVTKGTGTAISTEEASNVNAFMTQGTRNLTITNAAEVSKLEVVNMVGQTVFSVAKPESNIALNQLSNGVYLVKFALNNGKTTTAKIVIK